MYCTKCGTENKEDGRFCTKCGNDLKSPKMETERKEISGNTPNKMFQQPFSFDGRIRRSEFGISYITYIVIIVIIDIIALTGGVAEAIYIAYIPAIWFLLAQGTKRCHDRGNSGWYQLIPFYTLWMLFEDSIAGTNKYGPNPKGIEHRVEQTGMSIATIIIFAIIGLVLLVIVAAVIAAFVFGLGGQ